MKKIWFIILLLAFGYNLSAQADSLKNSEKVKTGLGIGGVPVVAYDSDTGFKYGGLVNFYHYGEGERYPDYNHSLYLEWSRTTKGSGINQIIYDAQTLIPKTRMTLEASYLTEMALDFYGFNGYAADFNSAFSDDQSDDYITRMYYRHARQLLRLKADFQGDIKTEKTRWLAGFAHYGSKINSVDIDKLNEGKEDNLLPDTATLYDKYIDWGVIGEDEKDGGNTNLIKVGFVYNTRDNEANPVKGIWSEILLLAAPGFLGNDYSYTRMALMHRQYLTIPGIKQRLTFAYRIGYQAKLSGEMPFYMLPYMFDSKQTRDGLGGANTVRGVLRNRVVGTDFGFVNTELRWIPFKTVIFGQNFYIGLNVFADAGMVTKPYEFDKSGIPDSELARFDHADEAPHIGYGAGIRFALNSNFIIAADYGLAAKEQDGSSGLYIGLNYLF